MKILNNKGLSLIEAIASVVIVSFVMISAFAILVNLRNQTLASQEKIQAIEAGERIRDNIYNNTNYNDLLSWTSSGTRNITKDNCNVENPPFSCNVIVVDILGVEFDMPYTITFYKPTTEDIQYQIVNFKIQITYYATRTFELTGIVYE